MLKPLTLVTRAGETEVSRSFQDTDSLENHSGSNLAWEDSPRDHDPANISQMEHIETPVIQVP